MWGHHLCFLVCVLAMYFNGTKKKVNLETFASCHQWLRLQFSVCYLQSVSVSQMTRTASASEAGEGGGRR